MSRSSFRRGKENERQISLSENDRLEFLRIVRDDIEFLLSLDYRRPSRTHVRLASSVLRRLLHEGMYQNAWTLAELHGQPNVLAFDLLAMVADLQPQHIDYAYAGGATTEGAHHKGMVLLRIPKEEAEAEGYDECAQRISKLMKPPSMRLFPLADFCQSPAVITGKASVSRLGIIRYVANKLGGVHWDNQRQGWTDPVGSRHRMLDEKHLMVGKLPAPLYEVISIAQTVASSEDATRFIQRVATLAPEPEWSSEIAQFREGRIGKYANITFKSKDKER